MDESPGPNRTAVVGLIVILLLVAGGLWLVQHIRADSRIQDCVMSGRTNCAPIAATNR